MAVAPCAGPQCSTLNDCSTVAQTWLYCSAVCRTRPHEAWSTRQDKTKTARSKGSTRPHEDACSPSFCACLCVENCQKLNRAYCCIHIQNKQMPLACMCWNNCAYAAAMHACRMRDYQRGKCGRVHAGRGVCRSGRGATRARSVGGRTCWDWFGGGSVKMVQMMDQRLIILDDEYMYIGPTNQLRKRPIARAHDQPRAHPPPAPSHSPAPVAWVTVVAGPDRCLFGTKN
jgi:hypothetical protein